MKKILLRIGLFCLTAGILFLSSCKDDFDGGGSGLKFLIGCQGNTTGLVPGLYFMTPGKKAPAFTLVTEYYPWYFSLEQADFNNGRIAFSVQRNLNPEGESGIVYFDIDDYKNVEFVPIPSAPKDFYYSVPDERPRVLSDGRIAYRVVLETANQWDDYHVGMLAIYDPKTEDIEISGDPSSFVLAQPEIGGDTEGGSMGNGFVISPDDRYAYCQVYGYGTDWGVYHIDYKFVVRYEIGANKGYVRMAQTEDRPTAVTGDNKLLILTGDGLHKIDLQTKVVSKVDDYANTFNPGQVSKNSSRMIKVWRGSGMGEFDWSNTASPFLYIINGSTITTTNYRGLGPGCQYSSDESKVYFPASTDFYTNYCTDEVIYSTPKLEQNATPDSITTIPVEYCTGFFLLVQD